MANNFVVYKSSAGSGKTFTLVKEYLKLALAENNNFPQQYKRILAITFTNKAAGEMKERILKALQDISENKKDSEILIDMLRKELGLSEEAIIERSGLLLSEILHNYSDFAISTIDSFTHKIVKTFAHDLKLPVNFNIETNTDVFYGKVVASLFSRIGENPELTNILLQYVKDNASENNSWDPEQKITEFTNLIKNEDAQDLLKKLQELNESDFSNIKTELAAYKKEFITKIKSAGNKGLEILQKNHFTDNYFHQASKGPHKAFEKWAKFNGSDIEGTITSFLTKAIEENKWGNSKNTNEENAALQRVLPELSSIAAETVDFIGKYATRFNLYSLIERNFVGILLLNELRKIADEFKNEEQIVFISEFNSKIAEIIHEEPAPFIFERLGERYQHFLLDEFQDTSTLQWLNLLPLIDNALASGKYNLIVGDGKQSIYRWRNANVRQFNELPLVPGSEHNPVLQERESSLIRNYKKEVLNVNFRSRKNIIEFNNSFFDYLPNKILTSDFKSIYSDQSQTSKSTDGGYVTIHSEKVPKDTVTDRNFELIHGKIKKALELNYNYKDICIIVRENKDGNEVAEFLSKLNIPVISSDSLLLINCQEIHCLVSFLEYLNNSNNFIHAASILRYLCKENNQLPGLLDKLKTEKGIWNILGEANINLSESAFSQKNVFDCCIEIIRAFELESKAPQYIRFFLDNVNEYLVNNTGSINDFLNWWETRKQKASLIIPDGTDAVTIMTIHRSKGLEFPIVILPFFSWTVFKSPSVWVDLENLENFDIGLPAAVFPVSGALEKAGLGKINEQETNEQHLDNINLLYVAFTRAVEQLHIISVRSDSARKDTVADWISDYLIDKHPSQDVYFEYGSAAEKVNQSKKKNLIPFELDNPHFNTNEELIKIKRSDRLKLNEEIKDARQKGIVMHYALSEINEQKDILKVLGKMHAKGIIELQDIENLQQKIEKLISHPLLSAYFGEKVTAKNEAEIITANGEILRPDRIVFESANAILIDYKTGKFEPDLYRAQMNKYSAALSQMGWNKVKKILVFPEEDKVVELN